MKEITSVILHKISCIHPKKLEAIGIFIILISGAMFSNIIEHSSSQITEAQFYNLNNKEDIIYNCSVRKWNNPACSSDTESYYRFDTFIGKNKKSYDLEAGWMSFQFSKELFSGIAKFLAGIGTLFVIAGKWRDADREKKSSAPLAVGAANDPTQ